MSLERRKKIRKELLHGVICQLSEEIHRRLKQRGNHSFASRHEILGLITEEYHELIEAVRVDKPHKGQIRNELLDIAVACVWGALSMDTDSVDW